MNNDISLSKLKAVFRRRKKSILATFALIFGAALVVAVALPSVYESQVLIVVENQEIPEEYVKSTTTSYVSERIEILQRKILSYQKLQEIIKAHTLYSNLGSDGEKVAKIRKNIAFETVDVNIYGKQGKGLATVAFTVAFGHHDPHKAKAVADNLANLFVEEDRRTRENRASNTTAFLEKEMTSLRAQVKEHEERISQFRAANIEQLPGSTGAFQQMVLRLEQDLATIDGRIRTLNEKNVYLKSQIANVDPLVPILTEKGKVASSPSNHLKYLRLQLIQLQANLSDKHPDIIRLKSEIQKLEAQSGQSNIATEQVNRLAVVEKQIIELKSKYGDKHPDVVVLTKEAALLQQQIARQEKASRVAAAAENSDNPEYMNLKAQIIVTESEIEALRAERDRTAQNLASYQRRLESAPFIDEQYNALTLDYENAKKKFNEVSNKLHTARIAQEMDLAEQGERFRIDRPAILPDQPSKPYRLLIILLGFMLGAGCGIAMGALLETLDPSVKAADEVEKIMGVPVLATIGYFDPGEKRRAGMFKL